LPVPTWARTATVDWGIPVQPNTRYRATLLARADAGFAGPVTVAILSEDGKTVYASEKVSGLSPKWNRFDWKKTLGPIQERHGHPCPWGYRSTDGMGLLEFLEWCEDMKVEAVLGVYAGYSLGGTHVNAGPDLEPFAQGALQEIEYVIGDTSTGVLLPSWA
jgi:hypothetical protein